MNTKEYSFWDLISDYNIEIPAIQRDYAQGRKSENRIAKNLIKDLSLAFEEDKKINLQFIYGKVDNLCLIPLDGQQRLTTLFLLHWFLSIGFLSDNEKSILSKFRYETRPSSEDFCLKLVNEGIEQYNENLISSQIENSKWFFLSWKNDPTISAMLNMLNIIQTNFKPNKDLFKKLVDENNPIRFHFLSLNKFKLDDKIYVKMNSRGKPLTEFENFKANFSVLFDKENQSKLDNEWLDIFWEFEKNNQKDKLRINIDEVDKKYLVFLKNVTLNFYVETNNIDKEFKDSFNIFDRYKEIYSPNSENLNHLSEILNSLTSFYDCKKYFSNFLKDDPDYWERLRFYAIMQFFIKKGKPDESNEIYEKWIRVCVNLINNSRIEGPEDFYKAIRSIKALSNNIDNLYEYLTKTKDKDKLEGFLQEQYREEIIKASLILDDENKWKMEIYKIERCPYFDGQIGFILEFSKEDEEYNIELFTDYSAKLKKLFDNEFKDNKNHLFQRALLTFGNYLVQTGSNSLRQTFCNFNSSLREKIDNWRKVFNDSEKSKFLKELINKINIDNIQHDLKDFIYKYSDSDWKNLFIKNEGIIEHCIENRIEKLGNRIHLCRSKAGNWQKYAELYSYTLYGTKLKNKTLSPFKRVCYREGSNYYASAAIVFDLWFFDNCNFSLEVQHIEHFILNFYNKEWNNVFLQIPEKVEELLKKLDFLQNNQSSWKYEIIEKDFDKIEEVICKKIKEMQEFNLNNLP